MGHVVHIRSEEQFKKALRVLDYVEGTWRAVGTSSRPVLLLSEGQYQALVEAGVVAADGRQVETRGKKATGKKAKS